MTPAQMKRIAKAHGTIATIYMDAAAAAEKAKAAAIVKKSVKKKAVKRGIKLKK